MVRVEAGVFNCGLFFQQFVLETRPEIFGFLLPLFVLVFENVIFVQMLSNQFIFGFNKSLCLPSLLAFELVAVLIKNDTFNLKRFPPVNNMDVDQNTVGARTNRTTIVVVGRNNNGKVVDKKSSANDRNKMRHGNEMKAEEENKSRKWGEKWERKKEKE